MPLPDEATLMTRPDGTSLTPGPKFHPKINATNVGVFEAGCWKRFLMRRAPPPGYAPSYLRENGAIYFSPLSFSYAWSRDHGMELRAFGTTQEGFSMCVRVVKFPPYIFARLPSALKDRPREEVNAMLRDYSRHLNVYLRNQMNEWDRRKINMAERVVHTEATCAEEHFPTLEYVHHTPELFARIYLVHPLLVRNARSAVEFPFGEEAANTKDFKERRDWLPDSFRARGVPQEGFQPYEADIDYVVRFLADTGLSPSAWWKIDERAAEVLGNSKASTCNLELLVDRSMLSAEIPDEVVATVAPYIKCKFDIEVETSTRFPQPESARVIQISMRMTFGDVKPETVEILKTAMKNDEYVRPDTAVNITLCLGSVRPRAGFVPICFKTEEALLWAFHEILPVLGIDDIAGHFSDGFDFWFLLKRAEALQLKGFRFLGRVPGEAAFSNVDVEKEKKEAMKKRKFSKEGRKDEYMTKIPGVCVWDFLFYAVAFERRATSFGLNALAQQFLKDKSKLDVEYALIAKMQQTETGRSKLADYCDQDVLLVQLLDDKIGASPFLREMADLSFVPRQLLLNRKSVFRAVARWLYEAQRYSKDGKRFLMPSKSARKPMGVRAAAAAIREAEEALAKQQAAEDALVDKTDLQQVLLNEAKKSAANKKRRKRASAAAVKAKKYDGGTVLEPCQGYYMDLITVFDFMGLYPAIMQWRNICYTTILPPGMQDILMEKYGLTEDDVWHAPIFDLSPDKKTTVARISKETMPSFVKVKCMEGILPYIERTLGILRKKKKRLMDDAYKTLNDETPDNVLTPEQRSKLQVLAKIYNNQQLCIKIFMNSLYGVMGATEASFPLRDGALTVTSQARQAIEMARYNAETHFPSYKVELNGQWRNMYELYDANHTHEAVQAFVKSFNERTPEEGLPFKPEVIYGDSVTGDCPVVVRCVALGDIAVVPISAVCSGELFEAWGGDKDRAKPAYELEVLADGGFTPIQAVVRHKTNKKLVETRTTSGVVVTTEDHSLIRADMSPAEPAEVKPGDMLATAPVETMSLLGDVYGRDTDPPFVKKIVMHRAWLLGFMFVHATLEKQVVQELTTDVIVMKFRATGETAGRIYKMAITEFPDKRIELESMVNETSRLDHVIHIKPKLRVCGRFTNDLKNTFSNLFLCSLEGTECPVWQVPANVLNGPRYEQEAFLEGARHSCTKALWDSHVKGKTFVARGGVAAQGLVVLLRRFFPYVSVTRRWNEFYEEDEYVLVGSTTRNSEVVERGKVIHVRDAQQTVGEDEYVYDLVTEKQRYCAGVGDTVVHNTDSIFVRYRFFVTDDPNMDDLQRITRAEKYNDYIAAELTKFYNSPVMVLQFEKICTRAYLMTKKKYMLKMWLREGGKYKMQIKESGTSGVRRDGCKLQRIMCKRVRAALMEHSSPEEAIEVAREILAYVLSGKAGLDEVMMQSTISQPIANYKTPGPPHVELARRMMKDGARPFNKGDRVYFIVVGGLKGPKKDKIGDRVRTPQEVIDNDIPYCLEYYGDVILNQARILLGPLLDPRSYEEKREFQDWARIAGFDPDGKARIKAVKDKANEAMVRAVDKVVQFGLPLEATKTLGQAAIADIFGAGVYEEIGLQSDDEEPEDDEQDPQETEDDDSMDEGGPEPGCEPCDERSDDATSEMPPSEACCSRSGETPPPGSCQSGSCCGTRPGDDRTPGQASEGRQEEGCLKRAREPQEKEAEERATKKVKTGGETAEDQAQLKRKREAEEQVAEERPKLPAAAKAGAASFFGASFKFADGGKVSATFRNPTRIGAVAKKRIVKTGVPKSSPLFKSIVIYDRCIGCNGTVPPSRGMICERCESENPGMRKREHTKQLKITNELEREHSARWRTCNECRGQAFPPQDPEQCDITQCINFECTNWGRRKVVTRELRKAHEKLAKIGLDELDPDK